MSLADPRLCHPAASSGIPFVSNHQGPVEQAVDGLRIRPMASFREVALIVVAYQAATTVGSVLDRIPATIAEEVGAILISDDASTDNTSEVARRWVATHPKVNAYAVHQSTNLGYGGNQKFCYQWARQNGFRYVLMIHGDGQYAPELALALLQPLLIGDAQAVFGSRMLTKGGARQGGMPRYKFIGNKVLTGVQNRLVGLNLSEWHSGYRAYDLCALDATRLDALSNGFDFDTEIILDLARGRNTIREVPIPTFYGSEKCHVNGLRYAKDVLVDVAQFRSRQRRAGRNLIAAR